MSKEQSDRRSLGQNKTERLFASSVLQAGFTIEKQPSIRCKTPVENRFGAFNKIVTNPDYLVIDPESNRRMYVEVTKGSGDWPSKAAQLRVVQAAGVSNYLQLTGDQVEALAQESSSESIRARLFDLFHWNQSLSIQKK